MKRRRLVLKLRRGWDRGVEFQNSVGGLYGMVESARRMHEPKWISSRYLVKVVRGSGEKV